MICKIAYKTGAGWFFWSDQLFSNPESAWQYVGKKSKARENFFLVFPDGKGSWLRGEENAESIWIDREESE